MSSPCRPFPEREWQPVGDFFASFASLLTAQTTRRQWTLSRSLGWKWVMALPHDAKGAYEGLRCGDELDQLCRSSLLEYTSPGPVPVTQFRSGGLLKKKGSPAYLQGNPPVKSPMAMLWDLELSTMPRRMYALPCPSMGSRDSLCRLGKASFGYIEQCLRMALIDAGNFRSIFSLGRSSERSVRSTSVSWMLYTHSPF
jgi:hypothetical protein